MTLPEPDGERGATAYERIVERLEAHDCKVIRDNGITASAQCPHHYDVNPSLSLTDIDGQALIHCHAGCEPSDVMTDLGLTMADLFDEPKVGVRYTYTDLAGNPTRVVRRTVGKRFSQSGDTKSKPGLYRLPDVVAAVAAGTRVYVVEGEKDANALVSLGAVATTAPMGATNWPKVDTSPLSGAHVVVMPDQDAAGRRWLYDVLASLEDVASSIEAVRPAVGKDAADHVAAGYGLTGFVPVVVARASYASVTTLSDVTPEFVEWAWLHRLPLGKIVILDGDPSVGKSTLATDWAARVSTGTAWPDGAPCVAGDVLILSAEDGLADTIRPRLDAAGGDPSRVHALTGVQDGGTERSITLADVKLLGDAVRRHAARLVIVDVFMAYLPGGIDSHRDQDVRSVLARLAALAEEARCCIVLLRHLNKSPGGNPLYRGGGSIAIVGAARAGYVAAIDPEDETRRVLACTKSNLAAMPTSLAYRLVDAGNGAARVQWLGATDATAGTVLAAPVDADERLMRDAAGEWLLGFLSKQDGRKASGGDVITTAKKDGIAESTLRRAAARNGVTIVRVGFGQGSVWSFPSPLPSSPSPPGSDPNDRNGDRNGETDPPRAPCTVCGTTDSTGYYADSGEHRCPAHNPYTDEGDRS